MSGKVREFDHDWRVATLLLVANCQASNFRAVKGLHIHSELMARVSIETIYSHSVCHSPVWQHQ